MQNNSNSLPEQTSPKKTFTTAEAAAFLALSPRTLEGWRQDKRGPVYLKQGRAVRYRLEDLIAFQEQSLVDSLN